MAGSDVFGGSDERASVLYLIAVATTGGRGRNLLGYGPFTEAVHCTYLTLGRVVPFEPERP